MKNSLLPLFILVLLLFSQCKDDESEAPSSPAVISLPEVMTSEIDSITDMTAVVNAEITSTGGSAILLKGVCYGTEPNPDLDGLSTTEVSESDSFTTVLEGLEMETEYFVRAYAVNSLGVSYGNELNFITGSGTTNLVPEVVTDQIEDITEFGALIRGEIITQGTSSIILKGICYGTDPNPDLEGEYTSEEGTSNEYASVLQGLNPDTEYYVRAYAVNSSGVSYGNELSFSTLTVSEVDDDFASSSPSVDFSSGSEIYFTAAFNIETNWIIEITGLESGAVKRITGSSISINASNSVWNGSATETSIFTTEQCEVTLTSPDNLEIEETILIEVLGAKPLNGDLITDFEQHLGLSLFVGDPEFELTNSGQVQDENAIQGSSYLYMEGTDNASGGPTDNFFVGLLRLFPSLEGNTYFSVPSIDPSEIYFNALVFNELPYSRLVIAIRVDSNNNGQFDDGQDQSFSIEYDGVPDSPNGWNDLNFTMSDVGMSSNDISKIVAIEFVLISLNNLQPTPREPVGFGLDYLSFSVGEPLDF